MIVSLYSLDRYMRENLSEINYQSFKRLYNALLPIRGDYDKVGYTVADNVRSSSLGYNAKAEIIQKIDEWIKSVRRTLRDVAPQGVRWLRT